KHLAEARRAEANAPHCADWRGAADQAKRFRGMVRTARKQPQYPTKIVGLNSVTIHPNEIIANSQETKGNAVSQNSACARVSLVKKNTYSPAYRIEKNPERREPNARERRAARDKQARLQRQQNHFPDATAFAYFSGWPLEHRITITWAACFGGER